MLDYEPPRAPLIPAKLLTEDYKVPPSTLSSDLVSCNFDQTHPTYDRGVYIKEDKGEIVNKESPKEEVQLAKDSIYQVTACHPYIDIGMCTPKEALKEGNNEPPEAEDRQGLDNVSHDVVSDYIIKEVPGNRSHANDAVNEKIVIADREDEAFTRKISDEDVQAQWYEMFSTHS